MKTLNRWKKLPNLSRKLFNLYDLCLPSSKESEKNLNQLGANIERKNASILIEKSNLNRQILFNNNDLNKYKVIQAKAQVKKIYKNIKIKTFKSRLTFKNIKSILKNYEIICDGTDNYETRYLINDFCKKNKKILISAAISRFDGHLFKFNFTKKGPCYRCFMPEQPNLENNCETEGIFSPVAGVMGSLQANEVLKTVLNLKSDLNTNMLIFNSLKMSLRTAKISVYKNCINKCKK